MPKDSNTNCIIFSNLINFHFSSSFDFPSSTNMARIRVMTEGVLSLSLVMAATVATATTITAAPAATDIAGALSTLLPTAAPASTEDTAGDSTLSVICQSDLFAAFFLHAAPSGDLASALTSYGSVLTSQACAASSVTATASPTADCSPAPSLWCAFPDVAPSSVLANYTSYGRAAASFLPSGLSPLVALATECPQAWYAAATMFPQGPDDLRDLVVLGECFVTARDGSAATGTDTRAATTAGTGTVTTASGTGKVSATATGAVTGSSKPSSGTGGRASSNMALPVVASACVALVMLVF